jgi:response regulator RpfG family c-di-GMP phosphodiesterase
MANPQILVVEDEGIVAADIQDRLISLGYDVPATVASGEEAILKIPHLSPDLVLMDIVLQGEKDGIEIAEEIRQRFEIPVVFLTAHADDSTLKRAKVAEPFAYILKPFEEKELQTALEMALYKHKVERERARLVIDEKQRLTRTVEASIKTLTKVLSVADPSSYQFGQKVQEYMHRCTESLKLEQAEELEYAALLCRIGFVTVPPILVQKLRSGITLQAADKDVIIRIPEAGRNLLAGYPSLESVGKIVYYQNKNFNGTGFPADGVGGVNIPFGARLLKILIDFVENEALENSKHRALEKMKGTPGQYDPKLLEDVTVAVSTGPKKGRAIPLKDLAVDQVLVEPIETNDGVLVLNAGNKVTPWMLKKLSNFVQLSGVREPIYVEG